MGWKTNIALVHGARVADLAALGWTPTGDTTSWEEASQELYDGAAAWERDGILVIVGGPDLMFRVDELGRLGATYAGSFMSTVDLYQWETAGDVGRRSRTWSEGQEVHVEGDPHPAEAGVDRLDEDSLFDLLAAGGLVYDERLEEAEFVVLDAGGLLDPEPAPRRRKRFGLF